jgi:hypothetical protein
MQGGLPREYNAVALRESNAVMARESNTVMPREGGASSFAITLITLAATRAGSSACADDDRRYPHYRHGRDELGHDGVAPGHDVRRRGARQ